VTPAWALLGSGEFDPWTEDVDRLLLKEKSVGGGRVLILPTASAAEGDEVFDMWADKGLDHYGRLGIEAAVVPLKTREDAAADDVVATLQGASMVFFSGGNPAYLASVLHDTPFWFGVREEMGRGLAFAGCSAGVACLGDIAPDSARTEIDDRLWQPGLRVFPGTWFGPHWDALDGFAPGLTDFIVSSLPGGTRLVGIDENTAMVGDGTSWSVMGVGGVHVLDAGAWTAHPPGEDFELALGSGR
jgi:cyanophycinase